MVGAEVDRQKMKRENIAQMRKESLSAKGELTKKAIMGHKMI